MFTGKTPRVCALSCLIVLGLASASPGQPVRRVPAEFEPQEAIWLQWPGRWEKTYEPAYAEITNVIVLYQRACTSSTTQTPIRRPGAHRDHQLRPRQVETRIIANITWHSIANENAWMRDNGPVYVSTGWGDEDSGLGLRRLGGSLREHPVRKR